MIEEIRKQHPEETPEQHLKRLKFRTKHLRKRRLWPRILIAVIILLVAFSWKAFAQTNKVDIQRQNGVQVDATGLPVKVLSGSTSVTGNVTVVQPTGTNLHTVCDSGCGGAASDTTGSGALGTLNAALQVAMVGQNSAAITLPAGNNLVGTLVAESSNDNAATWSASVIRSSASTGLWASTAVVNSTAGSYNIQVPGGASHVRVRVSLYTSGTATASIRATTQPDSQPDPLVQGTQAAGSATAPNPIVNGGWDGSNVRAIKTDATGIQQMNTTVTGTVTLGNLPQQPFLNTTDFSDTLAAAVATGSTIMGNATPKWAALVGSNLSAGGGFYNETQATLAAPSAPVLTVSNTGGVIQQASGQVEYVVVTLVNAFGETVASAEASIAVSIANGCLAASTTCSVTVTAPTLTGNATGYSVYSDRDSTGEQRQDSGSACVNITINCVIQGSGTGVSPPTINTASNGTLVVPTWKASTGTGNVVNATGATLSAKSLNNTVYADQYPGDICAAISRAWLDLPATGGTIDATGFLGSQSCATEPFLVAVDNSNKPFDLALGAVTINSTVSWYVPSNFHIHGVSDAVTVIAFQPAGGATEATKADLFHTNGTSNIEIDHIKFTGTANTSRIISLASGSNVRFHHNTISGAKYLAVAGPSCPLYIDAMSDVWIENNIFTANGPGPASGTSTTNADICTWTASAENRIHIRNNQISSSFEEVSIMMFDCLDCDLIGNDINQNNQITTTLTKGGYGIAVYGSVARPTNVRVEANFVKNCAGTCIYLASNDRAAVVGNTVSTCGQQETDGSLPVACIAANDCGNCTIDNNTATTSTKDGITVVAPAVGTVVSGNTLKTITQYGLNSRTATDTSWINNTVQTSTLDWFRDTGARNLVALNHALTSGAATTVATDYLLGNCIDATGCAFTFDAPANKTGETDIVADSGAINTTETVIVKTPALIASRLLAGSHIRITLTGTCTSTAANVSTFTLRWGTNGTTADGTVAALASSVAAVSGTNNGFRAVIDLTVRTAGASATSSAFMELMSDGNIGIVATPNEKFVAGTAFATTTASGILSLAYKSAATTTTSTFKNATIEVVYQ